MSGTWPVSKEASRTSLPGTRQALNLVRAALREIFDESAYSRFLARNQLASSPAAYAGFLKEHAAMKARRPRCC